MTTEIIVTGRSSRRDNRGDLPVDKLIEHSEGTISLSKFDESVGIRLWDVINKKWTGLLPSELVEPHYLKKDVYRCTGCNWVTTLPTGDGDVHRLSGHLKQISEGVESHADAEVLTVPGEKGTRFMCSACPASFHSPSRWRKHMETFAPKIAEAHIGATGEIIKRFVLSPPIESVATPTVVAEPESAQVVRSQRPAGSRRRRGRRGGKQI
jgi:hypothetical protein